MKRSPFCQEKIGMNSVLRGRPQYGQRILAVRYGKQEFARKSRQASLLGGSRSDAAGIRDGQRRPQRRADGPRRGSRHRECPGTDDRGGREVGCGGGAGSQRTKRRFSPAGGSSRCLRRRLSIGNPLLPTDPSFVPNEYGTGVVVDRRGLILTACHVLGDENDNYYITTSDRRVYRAWIKAADPRSDLAVLSIDGADVASANMVPIRLGDAATLRKGQIVVTLGNPYAIARDGQSSPAGASSPTSAARPRRFPTRPTAPERRHCIISAD